MRRLFLCLLGGAFVALAAVFVLRTRLNQATRSAYSRLATSGETAASVPLPKPGEPLVTVDPAAVFQRAFWRRPTADIRVLHGERREWFDASAAVQKWDWFVAVQTSADFRAWLLEQNPFEITATTTPLDPGEWANAPTWFPTLAKGPALTIYRSRNSKFIVLLDRASGQLFASDRGTGFAAAAR